MKTNDRRDTRTSARRTDSERANRARYDLAFAKTEADYKVVAEQCTALPSGQRGGRKDAAKADMETPKAHAAKGRGDADSSSKDLKNRACVGFARSTTRSIQYE